MTEESQIIKDDSRFIHGEDLQVNGRWSDITLTIKSVGEKDSMLSKEERAIPGFPVYFAETPKIAVLKGVNLRLLKAALSTADRRQMAGKKLTLYPVKGNWFGQRDVVAVRVRVPAGVAKPFIQAKSLGADLTR